MIKAVRAFFKCERGLETVEWAIVAPLIIVTVIGAFEALGGKVNDLMTEVLKKMP